MAELALLGAALAEGAAAAGAAGAAAVGEIGLGTVLSVGSAIAGGVAANEQGKAQAKAAKTAADFQSEQLIAAQAEAKAKASRKAEEKRDQMEKVVGRNRAVAAASGAGPDEMTLEGIYAEGLYQVSGITTSGENVARGLKDKDAAQQYDATMTANMAKAKGKAALVSGVLEAGTKLADNSMKLGGLYDDPKKSRLGYTFDDAEDAYG